MPFLGGPIIRSDYDREKLVMVDIDQNGQVHAYYSKFDMPSKSSIQISEEGARSSGCKVICKIFKSIETFNDNSRFNLHIEKFSREEEGAMIKVRANTAMYKKKVSSHQTGPNVFNSIQDKDL